MMAPSMTVTIKRANSPGSVRRRHGKSPRGGFEVGKELARHLVEARRQTIPESVVAIAERRAQVADDTTALAALPAADHFLDGVEPPKDLPQRIGRPGERPSLLDRIEQFAAPIHVPVEDGEAQVLSVAELVEECTLRHPGGGQNLIQLGVVIPLEGEETGRRLQDFFASLDCAVA